MKHDTNRSVVPSLVSDVLSDTGHCIDNLFADAWKALNLERKIKQAGLTKRSGIDISHCVCLLLWKWINVSSIGFFCREALQQFATVGKDVLYDLLKREDVNWRGLNWQVAKTIYREPTVAGSRIKAFVLDDSIKTRRGRKMEGVSCHFDHTSGRHVLGQQVLTLGLTTESAFMPLDSQIFISAEQMQPLNKPHHDQRSIVNQRYKEALSLGKPEMAEQTNTFASYIASIHLCAIRYLILVHTKLKHPDWRVADARSHIKEQLDKLTLAGQLWASFRLVIASTLAKCQAKLKCSAESLVQEIDIEVRRFLMRSLQLDALTLRLEHDCAVAI